MTETQQTDYEAIARDLFGALVDVAWEFDALSSTTTMQESELNSKDPLMPWVELMNRHVRQARTLASENLEEHAGPLNTRVAFPWREKDEHE